jgi:hypothetical protein
MQLVTPNFGYNSNAGEWRVDQHPRFMADTNGNGRADIVGFAHSGVYVSRANADGTFNAPLLVINNTFGYNAGGWRVDQHPRFVTDITGDSRADIVGFGDTGVWVSLAQADGSYSNPTLVLNGFGYNAGDWRVDRHPRFVADITGDGRADIIGFGNEGVVISLQQADGTFAASSLALNAFGYSESAGSWRVDRHPRFLADTIGNGLPDVVGFGDAGVHISRNLGGGKFEAPVLVVKDFGATAGRWTVDKNPRFVADTNGNGRADVVGFGNAGTFLFRL